MRELTIEETRSIDGGGIKEWFDGKGSKLTTSDVVFKAVTVVGFVGGAVACAPVAIVIGGAALIADCVND